MSERLAIETPEVQSPEASLLDVARPIRFDPAPTDINGVCRDAVHAASAGCPNATVSMALALSRSRRS